MNQQKIPKGTNTRYNRNMENSPKKLVCIETTKDTRLIDPEEILYCRIQNKKTMIVLHNNAVIETSYSLKLLEMKVLRNIKLLRCHANCLISLEHPLIYNSKKRSFVLSNGELITVAKDRKTAIKKALYISGMSF
jgi:DNA-binding LytR/AlgR family response regulator